MAGVTDVLQLEIPLPSVDGPPLDGAFHFLTPHARAAMALELGTRGAVVAKVEAIAVTSRGRLAEVVDTAVARALAARGLRPAQVRAIDLVRGLPAGARGVAILLGSLRALIDEDGALDADDSRTVRALARATHGAPLVLALDAADATLDAYAPPVPLGTLLAPPAAATATAIAVQTATDDVDGEAEPDADALADALTHSTPAVALESHVHVRAAVTAPAPPEPEPAPALEEAPRAPLPPPEVWRPWALALGAARGPQPLAAFERIFAQSYMPLARALEDGLSDPRATQACDEFRRNFARAYTEACPTFAVTGKRPRMVFDAPDLASKVARLHGARTTQLLLVDGLRFDLGLRVRDLLSAELADRASLAEEHLLWSALPTTTGRQMELLARGVEAMRGERGAESEEPLRGRTSETIRRVKIGHRDVFKLDVVQARLGEALPTPALGELAFQVTEAIARHAQTLASRTLLFVFGDHGFVRDAGGGVTSGGASPEEVLVPAFSFLVGSVH